MSNKKREEEMKEYRNDKGQLHRLDGPAIEWDNEYKAWHLNGLRHRIDGPAIQWRNGSKEWWVNGELHRLDGPAVERADGYKAWYKNGKLHREDGPAIEYPNGNKEWYKNGERHRLDGPALIYDGDKVWYVNDLKHRLDGPAIEYDDGTIEYFINGKIFPYEEFQKYTSFHNQNYSINQANIIYIRLEENLGLRISLYTELFIDGTYKIIQDKTLDQLVKGIDKDNPIINPLHDYILENLTSLNV
jgi:hypothetical protein